MKVNLVKGKTHFEPLFSERVNSQKRKTMSLVVKSL